MRELTALVIDDDEEIRAYLAGVLHGAGYRVAQAENGAIGIALAVGEPPDVITLDLRMPVLDGWQTVLMLKANPRTARVPVLAVSSEDFDGRSRALLEPPGFCAFLRKPVPPRDLLTAVERCLVDVAHGCSWVELEDRESHPAPPHP